MTIGTHSTTTDIVEIGELDDLDETYATVLLVLPERENIRMSRPDAQRLGYALFTAQGLSVTLNPREKN